MASALQVGNVQEERQEWRRPEDVTRFAGINYDIGYMLLDESPSDLAGQVVAAITAGAIALQQYEVIDRTIAKNMVRPSSAYNLHVHAGVHVFCSRLPVSPACAVLHAARDSLPVRYDQNQICTVE